mgnify:FL=1
MLDSTKNSTLTTENQYAKQTLGYHRKFKNSGIIEILDGTTILARYIMLIL